MECGHHRTDDQQPGAAVQHLLQQLWAEHHHLHPDHPRHHDPSDGEAEPPDKGDVRTSAKAQGDTGAPLEGPLATLSGDHEGLQGAGCEPARVPGPHVHPVSHLDRALPGGDPDASLSARESDRTVKAPLLLAPAGAPCDPPRQLLPVAGPRGQGPHSNRVASSGRRFHVAHAEDDHDAERRPQAGIDQPNDALDDAADVWILHYDLPQWSCPVLDSIQRGRGGNPGFRHRLGASPVPGLVLASQGAGRRCCIGVIGGGDDKG